MLLGAINDTFGMAPFTLLNALVRALHTNNPTECADSPTIDDDPEDLQSPTRQGPPKMSGESVADTEPSTSEFVRRSTTQYRSEPTITEYKSARKSFSYR